MVGIFFDRDFLGSSFGLDVRLPHTPYKALQYSYDTHSLAVNDVNWRSVFYSPLLYTLLATEYKGGWDFAPPENHVNHLNPPPPQ